MPRKKKKNICTAQTVCTCATRSGHRSRLSHPRLSDLIRPLEILEGWSEASYSTKKSSRRTQKNKYTNPTNLTKHPDFPKYLAIRTTVLRSFLATCFYLPIKYLCDYLFLFHLIFYHNLGKSSFLHWFVLSYVLLFSLSSCILPV